MQGGLTILGVAALMLTAVSALAERRRRRRRNIEAVGWMPWPLISILGTIAALFAFAFALRTGG